MKYTKTCECCGSKVTAFTHNVSQPMISAFIKFAERYIDTKSPININKDLRLTHSQKCNLPKMQYSGLIQSVEDNEWVLTIDGLQFYYGELSILLPVATMQNVVIPDNHEAWDTHRRPRKWKNIHDIYKTRYKQRQEYQEEKYSYPHD